MTECIKIKPLHCSITVGFFDVKFRLETGDQWQSCFSWDCIQIFQACVTKVTSRFMVYIGGKIIPQRYPAFFLIFTVLGQVEVLVTHAKLQRVGGAHKWDSPCIPWTFL